MRVPAGACLCPRLLPPVFVAATGGAAARRMPACMGPPCLPGWAAPEAAAAARRTSSVLRRLLTRSCCCCLRSTAGRAVRRLPVHALRRECGGGERQPRWVAWPVCISCAQGLLCTCSALQAVPTAGCLALSLLAGCWLLGWMLNTRLLCPSLSPLPPFLPTWLCVQTGCARCAGTSATAPSTAPSAAGRPPAPSTATPPPRVRTQQLLACASLAGWLQAAAATFTAAATAAGAPSLALTELPSPPLP